MVEKRSRITRKPAPKPEAVEGFLDQLSTDGDTSPAAPPTVAAQDDGGKGKAFPHRLSADFTTEQYKRLKRAGFETDQPMTTIVREAVEDWLKTRGY
ncbi:MAG: hypothetical protein KME14_26150 [Tildeniella torsiva UHER 1998/13D]|nr:hypothetical protein [Tildeniella torsiva UHER 1998/13D]